MKTEKIRYKGAKPTIHELEQILEDDTPMVTEIQPDGSVRVTEHNTPALVTWWRGLKLSIWHRLFGKSFRRKPNREVAIYPDHAAADAFWKYWRENGETHRHGYYESTWGAINAAIKAAGVVDHKRP